MRSEYTHLWIEHSVDNPQRLPVGKRTVAAYSRALSPDDAVNQDALAVLTPAEDHYVMAIADGAGGMPAGNRAAALAVQQLTIAVEQAMETGTEVQYGVMKGFEMANQAILDMGIGAGTTLTVVEILNSSLKIFHTGDSGVMVIGQRGRIKLQSIFHSPVGYAVEAGILSEREAMSHEDLYLVSNLLGTQEMRIDVGPSINLRPYDTVILGSDGLFDNLHSKEIVSFIRCGPLMKAASKVVEVTAERMSNLNPDLPGKADDLSFILYRPGKRSRNTRGNKN